MTTLRHNETDHELRDISEGTVLLARQTETTSKTDGRKFMKIAIGTDHAGFEYKERIKQHLQQLGHEVRDFGTHTSDAVDYPDFVRPAALAVARHECERGIVLGGSGNGEAIAANRITGVRCALCWNVESARLARLHNDANMISLGQRMLDAQTALQIVDVWLTTEFEGGRHIARIRKLDDPIDA